MTQGEGQANVPTTRFLLTPSPYLQGPDSGHVPCKEPPKPWVGSPRVRVGRGQEGWLWWTELWPLSRGQATSPYPFPSAQSRSDVTILSEAKVLLGPDPPLATSSLRTCVEPRVQGGPVSGQQKLSPVPRGGAQITHLSRRTTPSMQAPKRTTLLKSVAASRKARPPRPPLPLPSPCIPAQRPRAPRPSLSWQTQLGHLQLWVSCCVHTP